MDDDASLLQMVDMRAPVVPQIYRLLHTPASQGGMSKDMYLKWVHTPHYFDAEPKSLRFFASDVRELFTKVVWWMIPLAWLPMIGALLWTHAGAFCAVTTASHVGAGVLYWTFVEYVLHRFVFHLDSWTPDHPKALSLHFLLHGVHHKAPSDRYRLLMPPLPGVVLAAIVGAMTRLLSLPFIRSHDLFMLFFSGALLGYVMYDLTHYAFHHCSFSQRSVCGRMRKYHLKHHYDDQYNVGFGITSPFWDVVFGTRIS